MLAVGTASQKISAPASMLRTRHLQIIWTCFTYVYGVCTSANSKLTGFLSIKLFWKIMIDLHKMSLKSRFKYVLRYNFMAPLEGCHSEV